MRIYRPQKTWKQMPDATLSQANPVSTTLYPVLPTTLDCKVITTALLINWAITQPTPLELIATVDGRTRIFKVANPVSAIAYGANANSCAENEATQDLSSNLLVVGHDIASRECSGKSVKIDARITWGVTQPTPLVARVKYAVLV